MVFTPFFQCTHAHAQSLSHTQTLSHTRMRAAHALDARGTHAQRWLSPNAHARTEIRAHSNTRVRKHRNTLDVRREGFSHLLGHARTHSNTIELVRCTEHAQSQRERHARSKTDFTPLFESACTRCTEHARSHTRWTSTRESDFTPLSRSRFAVFTLVHA